MDSVQATFKPPLKQYIELLARLNIQITDIKNSKISLDRKKLLACDTLLEAVAKLDRDDDELIDEWDDILENLFYPKKQPKKEKEPMNFDGYNIGDDVIYYTNYTNYKIVWWGAAKHEMNVKCRIVKLNKCSITLQKYESEIDISDDKRALREQTLGKLYIAWTDNLLTEKVVVKDLTKIMRKIDDPLLYDDYIKRYEYGVDYRS